jgi:hypothetical protein
VVFCGILLDGILNYATAEQEEQRQDNNNDPYEVSAQEALNSFSHD